MPNFGLIKQIQCLQDPGTDGLISYGLNLLIHFVGISQHNLNDIIVPEVHQIAAANKVGLVDVFNATGGLKLTDPVVESCIAHERVVRSLRALNQ